MIVPKNGKSDAEWKRLKSDNEILPSTCLNEVRQYENSNRKSFEICKTLLHLILFDLFSSLSPFLCSGTNFNQPVHKNSIIEAFIFNLPFSYLLGVQVLWLPTCICSKQTLYNIMPSVNAKWFTNFNSQNSNTHETYSSNL